MDTLAHTARRLHRMERECEASAGQARLLGAALAILVAVLGIAALWG